MNIELTNADIKIIIEAIIRFEGNHMTPYQDAIDLIEKILVQNYKETG